MSRIEDEPHIDWYIPFSEFSTAYVGTEDTKPLILLSCYFVFLRENALYYRQGKWQIMLDNQRLGVIGGSPEFIAKIILGIPDLDEQVYRFLNDIKKLKLNNNLNNYLKWIPGLLAHIYGQKTADKMLHRAAIP